MRLCKHGKSALLLNYIPCSTNVVSVRVIFRPFHYYFISGFLYFGDVFNKTIIPLALVGHEMIIVVPRWLSIISYPTRARGIIVQYIEVSQEPSG